ncbi:TetR/AcrR family transcriptional regulator [Raineyella sp. W15-4]|uniref:TetR/AcrR family transcriptional regulator n=1 Tax=Raineyella sp. W15-4 TaxID=3081651 RepID=UPI0029543405|nr:TetR/AcrR family transcriptional regulator [Raineyella sp. W15-4]WOQ15582.1 TetR/AcrR family transcriptional regulator [Raineyella sp. W15-4]
MTMKGIAERAGVSRQTVYRWWSTKAEILLEASADDAAEELAVTRGADPVQTLSAYLDALVAYLTTSQAGAAYRALLGEAQYDQEVAALLAKRDPLGDSARAVITQVLGDAPLQVSPEEASALLIGPTFYWILGGRGTQALSTDRFATDFLALVRPTD